MRPESTHNRPESTLSQFRQTCQVANWPVRQREDVCTWHGVIQWRVGADPCVETSKYTEKH